MEKHDSGHQRADRNPRTMALVGTAALLVTGLVAWGAYRATRDGPLPTPERVHSNITTTVFWVGEDADQETNAGIHNRSSAWRVNWQEEFGGVDDPSDRCDMLPCGFTPKENPFYFALPYNDLDDSCNVKPSQADVPWYSGPVQSGHSIVKNRWIQIDFGGKTAYAQWEDAGPFGEDDADYVFGTAQPQSDRAGLDISPATAEYLGLEGRGQTSWQFVPENQVPDGPWKQTITTSLPDCAS